MKTYRPRVADQILSERLQAKGAVVIQGAKWCGKTTTARERAGSTLLMTDPSTMRQNLLVASMEPHKLLEGKTPRLIDEWQIAPQLWDAVRFEVDNRGEMGQFILTGSTVPPKKDEYFHSGTGRFTWMTMRPMSLFESGESNGSVSVKQLFQGKNLSIQTNGFYKLEDLAFAACRGGWPQAIGTKGSIALSQAEDYVDAVINEDISRYDGVNRDQEKTAKIMRSYARLQGNTASVETVISDISEGEAMELSRDTVTSYLDVLRKLFVIEDSPAWNPNLRSKTAIRTSDARYYVDPSIATAALGASPESLLDDLHLFGFIFETLCVRDLRVYAEAMRGRVYHYRDKRGLECDAVVVLPNGDYGLVEIKLGGDKLIEEAAKRLTDLMADLEKPPKFAMILTGTEQYAYRREDGILVVPVGCLRD